LDKYSAGDFLKDHLKCFIRQTWNLIWILHFRFIIETMKIKKYNKMKFLHLYKAIRPTTATKHNYTVDLLQYIPYVHNS
jgi:hypothetical protein